MKGLKHPKKVDPYPKIGDNQMEAIDTLAKIFSQQVKDKISPCKITMSPPRVESSTPHINKTSQRYINHICIAREAVNKPQPPN